MGPCLLTLIHLWASPVQDSSRDSLDNIQETPPSTGTRFTHEYEVDEARAASFSRGIKSTNEYSLHRIGESSSLIDTTSSTVSSPFLSDVYSTLGISETDTSIINSKDTSDLSSKHSSSNYNVLFLATSLYEFNMGRRRYEAGYQYLTYAKGDVFDVLDVKGELWLARNQDDPSGRSIFSEVIPILEIECLLPG